MSPPPKTTLDPSGRIHFPWVHCLAGMSAGVITNSLLQPLDVAKTSLINPSVHTTSLRQFFISLRDTAGYAGFWRGVDAAILRISLGSGVYFTTQTYLLEYAHRYQQRQEFITPPSLSSSSSSSSSSALPSSVALGVGFVSRGCAVVFCCPISVVKTRLEGSSTRVPPYRNVFHGLITVARTEGIRGLYAGVVPSVIKDAPYGALYLLFYTRFKDYASSFATTLHLPTSWTRRDAIFVQLCAGLTAGGVATIMVHPTEVIKTRMQLAASNVATNPTGTRLLSVTRSIYTDSGIRGFFRGSIPRCTKRALSNAISWMLFEQLVSFWHGATHL